MRIVECEQGSAQWLQERVGRLTASRVSEAMSKFKDKKKKDTEETAERRVYRIDLVTERLTRRTTENFNTPEMQWGRDHEDDARIAYELYSGVMVERIGFILHPSVDFIGASPDGLVGYEGGLEIKCPKSETHVRWMLEGVVPEEHIPQIDCNLLCSERLWWDFVSYDPRLENEGLDIFVARRFRNEEEIAQLEYEAIRMHHDVDRTIAELKKKARPVLKPKSRVSSAVETSPPIDQWATEFDRLIYGEVTP